MGVSKALAAAAPQTGLKSHERWLFGRYRGFPVAVREMGASQGYQLVFQIVLTPEAVAGVQRTTADKARAKAVGLKPGAIGINPTERLLVYGHMPTIRTKPEQVKTILDGLVSIAESGGPPLGDVCEECRTERAPDVILLNGSPTQLCGSDFQKLTAAFRQHEAVVRATEPNYGLAIAAGLAGLVLGGLIWAAIGVVTGSIFVLGAFLVAAIVGGFIAKASGVITIPLVVAAAAFTMFAILLGDVITTAIIITQQGGPLDLVLAFDVYLFALSVDPSIAASYVFGLIGVLVMAWYMMKGRTRTKPRFEVVT